MSEKRKALLGQLRDAEELLVEVSTSPVLRKRERVAVSVAAGYAHNAADLLEKSPDGPDGHGRVRLRGEAAR